MKLALRVSRQPALEETETPNVLPGTPSAAVGSRQTGREMGRPSQRTLVHLPESWRWTLRFARGQLLRVIGAMLEAEFKTVPSPQAGFANAREHMIQVFEKLSADDLLGLPVGELAARFGCSRRQLNRLFQQQLSVSVAAMRMEMRLLKAVTLLRDPAAKVINIAEQCGFNHLGLFNTCFKRRFGASPSEYRKKMVQPQVPSDRPNPSGPVCPLRSYGFCPWVADGHDAPSGISRRLKSKPSARQHSSASTVPPGAVSPSGRTMARDVHNPPSFLVDDATAFREFMEQL